MQQSLKEETEGKRQMLLSLRKNGKTSLFKEVRVFKVCAARIEDSVSNGVCEFACSKGDASRYKLGAHTVVCDGTKQRPGSDCELGGGQILYTPTPPPMRIPF